jgi:hypothetical protein
MPIPVDLEVGEERVLPQVPDEDRPADLEGPAGEGLSDLLLGRRRPRRFLDPLRCLEERVPLGVESAKDGLIRGDMVENDFGDPGQELMGHAAWTEPASGSHLSDDRSPGIFSLRRLGGIS